MVWWFRRFGLAEGVGVLRLRPSMKPTDFAQDDRLWDWARENKTSWRKGV
jgi:hypothetical protein